MVDIQQDNMSGKQIKCNKCHQIFTRKTSLLRHQNGRCKHQPTPSTTDIPTFDGAEFIGGNPPKETMEKLKNHIKTKAINNILNSMDEQKAAPKPMILDYIINGKEKVDKNINGSEVLSDKKVMENQTINEITKKGIKRRSNYNPPPKQKISKTFLSNNGTQTGGSLRELTFGG